jgi:hypothetical protein
MHNPFYPHVIRGKEFPFKLFEILASQHFDFIVNPSSPNFQRKVLQHVRPENNYKTSSWSLVILIEAGYCDGIQYY